MLRFLFYFLAIFIHIQCFKIINTSLGKVQGTTILSNDGNHKYLFKSLPFAKPPTGKLRFELPQYPESWTGILNATEYSSSCMSNFVNTTHPQKSISEDCLYLNIFTSETCLTKKCPVLVYIHGGAFRAESAVMFSDEFILERYVSEDVVFVTSAYRLGVFGQLYFGPNGGISENLLVHDAIKSLQFIHKEISNFGGITNQVTLMGHSAGGALVQFLGFSDLIDPNAQLFQQMITLSAHGAFVKCFRGNRNDTQVSKIVECLKKTNGSEILNIQTQMVQADFHSFLGVLPGPPVMKPKQTISNFKKNAPKRNMICGSTELEFAVDKFKYPVPGRFLDVDNFKEDLDWYYKNMEIHNWTDPNSSPIYISSRTYCEAMAKAGANAFIFETRQKPMSMHVTDMQYFIGIHREKVHTPDMDILDGFYSKMLVNFTKTGVPAPGWEKLDPKRMNYLELKVDSKMSEGPRMLENYHEKEMDIWFGEVMEYDRNVTKQKLMNLSSSTGSLLEGQSIFNQWWIYVIVLVVVIIIILVLISFKKQFKSGERTPLLS